MLSLGCCEIPLQVTSTTTEKQDWNMEQMTSGSQRFLLNVNFKKRRKDKEKPVLKTKKGKRVTNVIAEENLTVAQKNYINSVSD